jgi:hypothetical protein
MNNGKIKSEIPYKNHVFYMLKSKLLIILLSFLLLGCEKKVNIEVFIATDSGENVKLGLVNVKAVSLEEAEKLLKNEWTNREIQRENENESIKKEESKLFAETRELDLKIDPIRSEILEKKKNIEEIKANCNKVAKDFIDMIKEVIKYLDSRPYEQWGDVNAVVLCQGTNLSFFSSRKEDRDIPELMINHVNLPEWDAYPVIKDKIVKGANSVIEARRKFDAANEQMEQVEKLQKSCDELLAKRGNRLKVERLSREKHKEFMESNGDPMNFYAVLPQAIVSATTNADGRCELKLPSGKKWIIAATSSRMVGNESEKYVWIIELPKDFSSGETLILSNNNALYRGMQPLVDSYKSN